MALPSMLTTVGTHIGLGLGLFWGVHRLFAAVGDVLSENHRLEIAVWLLDLRTAATVEPWTATFAKVFDRVFGDKHVSWRCFWKSSLASLCMAAVATTLLRGMSDIRKAPFLWCLRSILGNVLPDYISLLETRSMLTVMSRLRGALLIAMALWLDLVLTNMLATLAGTLGSMVDGIWLSHIMGWPLWPWARYNLMAFEKFLTEWSWIKSVLTFEAIKQYPRHSIVVLYVYPAYFTSIWLWLYALAGFALRGAGRFDALVAWLISHMDIEKKPLHSIGLVAGAIVAIAYWTAVAVMRWV
jgi:hypothetical protein